MPSRLSLIFIVVFWLAAMTWLVLREVAPRWRTGEPPPIAFDVLDEIGANSTNWVVFKNDDKIGFAESSIKRKENRTFEIKTMVKFEKSPLPADIPLLKESGLDVKKITSKSLLTADGDLLEIEAIVNIESGVDVELRGPVLDQRLALRLSLKSRDQEVFGLDLSPVNVPRQVGTLNSLHVMSKVPGLQPGQSWRVKLMDPLEAINFLASASPKEMVAEVFEDAMVWNGRECPCHRVDVALPGHPPVVRTWVHRRDGLVLKHETRHDNLTLTLLREIPK